MRAHGPTVTQSFPKQPGPFTALSSISGREHHVDHWQEPIHALHSTRSRFVLVSLEGVAALPARLVQPRDHEDPSVRRGPWGIRTALLVATLWVQQISQREIAQRPLSRAGFQRRPSFYHNVLYGTEFSTGANRQACASSAFHPSTPIWPVEPVSPPFTRIPPQRFSL
uniref:Uncharacterized protein n=1 Tax=Mycena chlorophos TaxID=658473 RepID=A0ABQ0LWB6_MYCCL|nr:predicted protein [Mycena chlorophos]